MILCVGFSPSIDKIYFCPTLTSADAGKVRAERSETYAGGKAINVARGVCDLGGQCLVLGFAGGYGGQMLRRLLDAEGIAHDLTETREEVKLNPTIRCLEDHSELHVSEMDRLLSDAEMSALEATYERNLTAARLVVIAGRCPPGTVRLLRGLLSRASQRGVKTMVDTSGAALKAVVETRCWMVKINAVEAAEVTGLGNPAAAARRLLDSGNEWAMLSNAQTPALLMSREVWYEAQPPSVPAVNHTGCGDAMTAAVAVAVSGGAAPQQWLQRGVAAGTANVLADAPGRVPRRHYADFVQRVAVTQQTLS
jgi:1-phosphofructokinase family hexose kinase